MIKKINDIKFLNNTNFLENIKNFLKKKNGWVYIAKCSTHNYLKIGRTSKTPEDRAKSLSNSGVPADYQIIFALQFFDSYQGEKDIFKILNKYRVNKEFFLIKEEKAVEIISKIWNNERELLKSRLTIDLNDLISDFDLLEKEHFKNEKSKQLKI